jgi:hypothetical protein
MKINGILLVALGSLLSVTDLIALVKQPRYAESSILQLFFALGLIGLGIYFIMKAKNKKKKDLENRDKDSNAARPAK